MNKNATTILLDIENESVYLAIKEFTDILVIHRSSKILFSGTSHGKHCWIIQGGLSDQELGELSAIRQYYNIKTKALHFSGKRKRT